MPCNRKLLQARILLLVPVSEYNFDLELRANFSKSAQRHYGSLPTMRVRDMEELVEYRPGYTNCVVERYVDLW